MHMADALVSPIVAGTMYACSLGAAGYSINKIKKEDLEVKTPTMGVMGAFVFAAQMINFTIPGTGASGHLCGGMLLTALLGPYEAFITMIGILLIQCLMFADGGLLALGANVWNMAFYGCFVGGFIIWKLIMKKGINKKKIVAASILGCIITLQLGAFSVTLETMASGVTKLPFTVFVAAMQPIHLIIGLVEGLITSAVLCFVYEVRPDMLWSRQKALASEKTKKYSIKKTLIILFLMAVALGGAMSLVASENPDGLEWAIEKITGSTEVASNGMVYSIAENIQSITSVLPDYGFKNADDNIGTSFSGVVGGLIVVAVCVVVSLIIKAVKRKTNNE